jgi:hypothetical protein
LLFLLFFNPPACAWLAGASMNQCPFLQLLLADSDGITQSIMHVLPADHRSLLCIKLKFDLTDEYIFTMANEVNNDIIDSDAD